MSKTVKIVIGVVIAIIVLAVVYYMFFATPSTPEAAAQKKVFSSQAVVPLTAALTRKNKVSQLNQSPVEMFTNT